LSTSIAKNVCTPARPVIAYNSMPRGDWPCS
jgi:hypothetical protein